MQVITRKSNTSYFKPSKQQITMKKVTMSFGLLGLCIALSSSSKGVVEGISGPSGVSCGSTATYYSSASGAWSVSVNGTGAPVTIVNQSSNSITILPSCYYPHPGCPAESYHVDIEKGNNSGADLVIWVNP